ncbi:hypothetical protein COE69_05780 [Bacillus wiedmannii]|nr:hypothetical protein COE69_05780 [Bacillus wiedmannii]
MYISKSLLLLLLLLLLLIHPHAHQAKILRHPHNENFTFLQLFMKIPLVFFIFGVLDLKLQQYA